MSFLAIGFYVNFFVASFVLVFLAAICFFLLYMGIAHQNRQLKLVLNRFEAQNAKDDDSGIDRIIKDLKKGICSIDHQLALEKGYSEFFSEIFGPDLKAGMPIRDVLKKPLRMDEKELDKAIFHWQTVMGMNKLQWKLTEKMMLKKVSVRHKSEFLTLKLYHLPRFDRKGNLKRIILVIEDVTEFEKTQKENLLRQKEMEKIISLLEVPEDIFSHYIYETNEQFDQIKKEMKALRLGQGSQTESLNTMMRLVHTIKGNSGLFHFQYIQKVCHDAETFMVELFSSKGSIKEHLPELMDLLVEMNEEIYSYTSLRRDILGRSGADEKQNLTLRIEWVRALVQHYSYLLSQTEYEAEEVALVQGRLARALESFSRSSLQVYIARYNKMIQSICTELKKSVGEIDQEIGVQFFDVHTLAILNDVLVQCIRNSLDHGFETPKERVQLGKASEGRIKIRTRDFGSSVMLEYSDDGKGIDRDALVERALAKNLLTPAEADALTPDQKLQLIFHPGLSTSQRVSELSGRGVGMDAVVKAMEQIGGSIQVQSTPGQGTVFTLRFHDGYTDLVNKFAMVEVYSEVNQLFEEIREFSDPSPLSLLKVADEKPYYALVLRKAVHELIKRVFLQLMKMSNRGAVCHLDIKRFRGRRTPDSGEFYRLTFSLKRHRKEIPISKEEVHLKAASDIAENLGGSVWIRNDFDIEVNIPNHLPAHDRPAKTLLPVPVGKIKK